LSFPTSGTHNLSLPLRIDGLVKRFGEMTAVDGITLELLSGECLGLLGPNGAGKSTLIRSIVGRVRTDAGTISVFGAPADSMVARNTLGWIPQELALYPRLTCRENLQSFGRYHGLGSAPLAQAVERCLGWATLTDRSTELVKNLSGGMKRRLNMAAGLIHPAESGIRLPAFDGKGVARLISAIVRTAVVSLRRDRGALALSFILPVVFFSIFAVIFGGRRDTTSKIHVLVVDEDHSRASGRLLCR
jgi:ABC-type uncharacterized transport system ATPase subunit